MTHRPHILALATAVVALSAALKSIRSPGTEGYASAQHAEDLVTNVLAELNDVPVGDLQADARTTMTTNPHTIEPQAADLADRVTETSIKEQAAEKGVAVDKAPGADIKDPDPTGKPANATGAVTTKTAG